MTMLFGDRFRLVSHLDMMLFIRFLDHYDVIAFRYEHVWQRVIEYDLPFQTCKTKQPRGFTPLHDHVVKNDMHARSGYAEAGRTYCGLYMSHYL